MGAVDLVIQIEAPPSVASGMQRIGRAGHSRRRRLARRDLPEVPRRSARARGRDRAHGAGPGRGDVLPAQPARRARAADRRHRRRHGRVRRWTTLFALVRRAAPFAELPRGSFEGVLDMLSGRYPVRRVRRAAPAPHLGPHRRHAARARGRAARRDRQRRHHPRPRALRRLPRRGDGPTRDEPRASASSTRRWSSSRATGDVFLLGASSWRIEEITHDRVLVTPAPGRARQDAVLARRPARAPARVRRARSARSRASSPRRRRREAAQRGSRASTGSTSAPRANLRRRTCTSRPTATGEVPSDRTIVVERYLDELGDCRVCVLSPFGARVHAPWAHGGASRRLRGGRAADVETLWSRRRHGLPPARRRTSRRTSELFFPAPDEVEDLRRAARSAQTSLFAARFRENAGARAAPAAAPPGPAHAALGAAQARARTCSPSPRATARFPILLETYRECLRDVFDLPGARRDAAARSSAPDARASRSTRATPSPFAASLLFSLRRELHLRRRRAAGRAARAGALGRPGAAPRAARRGRAPRAARRRRHRSSTSARRSGSRGRRTGSTGCTICCSSSAISPRRRCAQRCEGAPPFDELVLRAARVFP